MASAAERPAREQARKSDDHRRLRRGFLVLLLVVEALWFAAIAYAVTRVL